MAGPCPAIRVSKGALAPGSAIFCHGLPVTRVSSRGERRPTKGPLTNPDNTHQVVVAAAEGHVAARVGRQLLRIIPVSVSAARRLSAFTFLVGARASLAGLFLLGASDALQTATAEGDTRSIAFHNLHTKEDIAITFKRNGRYDEAALKKLNWYMRDWRKDEEVRMNPHLFDLLWETNREVGGTQPIEVICGYRSPATNSMLRARSSGVAQSSQHTQGQAIDFHIPGVPLAKVREVGLRLQRGGVGFYPSSGSPFIHMDTGSVRHWPRMTYAELSKVFPDGRTVHVASDGRPLPGYAVALAEVERRGGAPNSVSLQAARSAGVITASQEQDADSIAAGAKPKRNLFASLFGFGKQKDAEETADEEAAAPAPKRARPATVVASLAPPKRVATENIVPLPSARPNIAPVAVAAAQPQPAEQVFTTAAASGNVFDSRGYWPASADSGPAQPRAKSAPFDVASADMTATGTTAAEPLAYAAAAAEPAPAARPRPMGKAMLPVSREAAVTPASASSTVAAKPVAAPVMSFGGQRADSPWLRAAMLTPSVRGVMTATSFGTFDPRPLHKLLHQPSDTLTMTFSAEPAPGLMADRFNGSAVVFLATTSFAHTKTAALR